MPKITFLPDSKVVQVETGTSLPEAAQRAGVTIPLPCACKGVCGKCMVHVVAGSVEFQDNGKLPEDLRRQGYVLACRSKVAGEDVEISIPSSLRDEEGQFADTGIGVAQHLFPTEEELCPLTVSATIRVEPAEMLDGLGDYDRLRNACLQQLEVEEIHLPLALLRKMPDAVRDRDGQTTVWYRLSGKTASVVDLVAGEPGEDYGLAVDIGTTTVALQLVDMRDMSVVDTVTQYNAQIDRGLDVISRINYAKNTARIEEMRTLILKTINEGIAILCERSGGIDAAAIRNVSLAANTTMVQMFLGIKPEYIRLEPYTPAVMGTPLFRADEIGMNVNPHAFVWVAPNVGSYVGGDITSGLLCTDFAVDAEELSLFIDIGTNGEIVLGNSDFLMSCACSAGPAFEGGGIEMGMRASTGAIDRIEVDPETGACAYGVIGGGKPLGLCGSGLISLVAQLFETGIIDPRGKMNRSGKYENIDATGKNARYYIVPPDNGDMGVYLTENDIDNVIRAKAAIFSAVLTMLNSVELDFESISRIYIAGGFGRFLDIEKSQVIGLFPYLDEELFDYIGNSSLTGAYMTLVSKKHRDKEMELASRMTYVDLSTEVKYMDEYVSAMFLPHTNEKLFQKKG